MGSFLARVCSWESAVDSKPRAEGSTPSALALRSPAGRPPAATPCDARPDSLGNGLEAVPAGSHEPTRPVRFRLPRLPRSPLPGPLQPDLLAVRREQSDQECVSEPGRPAGGGFEQHFGDRLFQLARA